jgi:hypothetical protein
MMVLPTLGNITLQRPEPPELVKEVIEKFVAARRLSDDPIVVFSG